MKTHHDANVTVRPAEEAVPDSGGGQSSSSQKDIKEREGGVKDTQQHI
jgi:hypothetical protein